MPSGAANYNPPAIVQKGNLPILDNPDQRDAFLMTLEMCEGNLAEAASRTGVSRHAIYRHMMRDALFAETVGAIRKLAVEAQAGRIVAGAYAHLESHLESGWVFDRDPETGEVIVDDDFNPIRRSVLPIKSLVDAAREGRHATDGEGARISIQNVAQAAAKADTTAEPVKRPRLVQVAEPIEDAEIITEEPCA